MNISELYGKQLHAIVTCNDIIMQKDNDYMNGTGTVECPFEKQCLFDDCEKTNRYQIVETCLYREDDAIFLKDISFKEDIELGKNIFLTREDAEVKARELNLYENYIIINKNKGVFLGTIFGLTFFSDLDTVGQQALPSFVSKEEAESVVERLKLGEKDEFTYVKIGVTTDRIATKQECLQAYPELAWNDLKCILRFFKRGAHSKTE